MVLGNTFFIWLRSVFVHVLKSILNCLELVFPMSICMSFLSELKQLKWLSFLGLLMVLCGEGLRKAAMLTAGSNFNHIVQNEKAQSHVLVTSGVYAYFRHPSYVGWFYWSTGTQVSSHLSYFLYKISTCLCQQHRQYSKQKPMLSLNVFPPFSKYIHVLICFLHQ